MHALKGLFFKKKKIVIGLMSGTSADGIDAALVEITGNGADTRLQQLAFQTYPYPHGYKEFLLKNSRVVSAKLNEITRLNILIAEFFADAARRIVRSAGKRMDDIDLIGSHGQTIHHLPLNKRMFGKNIRATLQLGNPAVIAKLTGVVTIGDFRSGDIAVGGTGAPLVPYFDYLMFRSKTKNRGVLNIGGIANITVVPKKCSINDVVAFDTGPGNMVIDGLMKRFYGKPYDNNGSTANKGKLLPHLLHWMMQHPYFKSKPPKSTGRELFGETFIDGILKRSRGKPKQDIIATVTEFTALSIYWHYAKYIVGKIKIQELLVSGGGVHNSYLMDALKRYFDGVNVLPTETTNISSDAKEAICFAVLANETIAGNPTNIPGATGARISTVLGTISLP
jgi:anhydro-N-acetylmuramic acid kinase